jgi:hypothetical protein
MARSVLNVDDFEWVELTNVTDQTVDLGGCELRDAGSDVHTIAGSLVAAPNTPLLLVRTASETEYGKAPDYVYGTSFGLGNTGDEITLRCDGVTIDTVTYTSSWVVLGTSQQLSGTSFDAASNDAMSNWCPGTATYNAVPKYGTPGSANHDCSNP